MTWALGTPFVRVRCAPSVLVSRCAYVKVRARGAHPGVVVGGFGEDVVYVVKRALVDQGAQHAVREGVVRAIDARVAVCVCHGVSTSYTPLGGSWRYRRIMWPMW